MNKIEQLNKQIVYHKEQLNKLRLVKLTLKERVARKEYEQFYWSVVGKYFKIIEEDDVTYLKVIYTDNSNNYLTLFTLSREGYKFVNTIVFDSYYQEYYKSISSIYSLKTAIEITEKEFWKHNKKYEINRRKTKNR